MACLQIARGLVAAKIANCRTFMRRNYKGAPENGATVVDMLKRDQENSKRAESLASLLGFEGSAAALYFEHFGTMLKGTAFENFDFNGRNRRPPTDPVNALLSFTYAMLARAWTVQISAVGLDAYRGFYHQPRYGRPALADHLGAISLRLRVTAAHLQRRRAMERHATSKCARRV